MVAPVGLGGASGRVASALDVDAAPAGPLERLMRDPSPLDRLVADAGALGRFITDRADALLPAGTSAFTRRSVDTTDAVAARLALPRERAWSGNPVQPPLVAGLQQAAPTPPPVGQGVAAPDGVTVTQAPRGAVSTQADNHVGAAMRNLAPPEA